MDATTLAVLSAAFLLWALLSARLGRVDVSGPMALVALGALADQLGWIDVSIESAPVAEVAQTALALLLFSDVARVDVSRLRDDAALPARLLAIGLPLTIGLGMLVAHLVDPAAGWPLALVVGACLAPTDAGLGAQVVSDPTVPRRVRRTLNVESGLNDGIAAPVVAIAIAWAADEDLGGGGHLVIEAARELGLGVAVGLAVGLGGGLALRHAHRQGWTDRTARPLAVLALAVLADTAAIAAGGNGFIAAFVAGMAFGPFARELVDGGTDGESPLELSEMSGQLLGSVVWFLFGSALLGPIVADLGWHAVLYAVLSLTAVRMVPVALSLVGLGLDRPTVGFIAWFGPRGLASLIFAIDALDQLGAVGDRAVAAIGFTVLLSVAAHGSTARPLSERLAGAQAGRDTGEPGTPDEAELPGRLGWLHRRRA